MVHPFFSIEFVGGKCFTLKNVNKSQIRTALREHYPNWVDKLIEFHVNNEGNYRLPKYGIRSVDEVREQIAKRGTPLNALIRLVKSYDAYYRNGYRQWGNNGKKVIDMLAYEFIKFNNAFARYNEAKSERQIGDAIADLIDAVQALAHGTKTKGCHKLKFERAECVDGKDRRLGILELAERVPIILQNFQIAA